MLLDPNAKAPTVAHPAEDLAYDLYALEDCSIDLRPTWVRTGIAVEDTTGCGFLVKDRSSMAGLGVFIHGGVIDPGYRGEIKVNLTTALGFYRIHAGDKIAQMVPVWSRTAAVSIVDKLNDNSSRGSKGFGSSGT